MRTVLSIVVCFAVTTLALAQAPSTAAAQVDRAARSYEQGNCRDVLAAIEAIPNAAQELATDGLTQYRWAYCLAATGQAGPDREHYETAANALGEQTKSPSARLDAYFYRVNALLNLGRREEAVAAAKLALERHAGGTLTVPAEDPQAWFQLGKLNRDAGQPKGALAPYKRAVELAAAGRPLRSAYLERIADLAIEQGDMDLANRANGLLAARPESSGSANVRTARMKLAAGDFAGAREIYKGAAKGGSDAATDAQYALAAIDRLQEVAEWKVPLATSGGRMPSELSMDDLRKGLAESAQGAWKILEAAGEVEVPRKNGRGTRPAPDPVSEQKLRTQQGAFCELLGEALVRQAPLQEWSFQDGYAALIHNPWNNVFNQKVNKLRVDQVIETR